jgi:HD-GYP domain-containing protein (c-di-GMP phosphodiesterase class II)
LQTVAEIVLQHHERLDGSGFPRHLRGRQIHIGAAIIAVVDVFHNALYRRRREARYRHAAPTAPVPSPEEQQRYIQVLRHLEEKAGSVYHPAAVRTFIELVEEGRHALGQRLLQAVAVNQLREGMVVAENYYTPYGLLVIAQGERLTSAMLPVLVRFAELGEIPHKLLVWV